VLAPARRRAVPREEESVPIFIRQYLDPSGAYESEGGDDDPPEPGNGNRSVERASATTGGVVLLAFLEGLRADLAGGLVDWYAELLVRVPHALGLPAAVAPELTPPAEPSEWQALAELKSLAQELLGAIAGLRPNERVSQLSWRLALVEDAFAGALRRLDVPVETAARSAADVGAAAGLLFGLRRPSSSPS
jgi:hypothetical protein